MGVRLYFKFHRYMLPVCRSWNKLAGIWVFLLCQAYNTQRTYFPGDWLKPSTLCSILMMKYRFPIKRKSLPFRMLKMIRKREGGKKKKKTPSWLNLGRWKRSSWQIIPGHGPTTFSFDCALDTFSFILSPSLSVFCSLETDKLESIALLASIKWFDLLKWSISLFQQGGVYVLTHFREWLCKEILRF